MKEIEFLVAPDRSMHDFSDKAILITGSSRGIGRGIAELLISQGAIVGIHGRDIERVKATCKELSDDNSKTIPLTGDLSNPETASQLVKDFVDTAGKIDGLVNNAGGGKAVAFRGLTLEKWQQTFHSNLDAAMIASQQAYIFMRKQKQGAIVNIASLAAHGPGKWMGADYAASKAGLVSLTKSLAFEAARFGIRVNAVSPGMVETDMTSILPEKTKETLNIPMGRFAKPAEIAEVTAFFLSDMSSYITGQVLQVNGGLAM